MDILDISQTYRPPRPITGIALVYNLSLDHSFLVYESSRSRYYRFTVLVMYEYSYAIVYAEIAIQLCFRNTCSAWHVGRLIAFLTPCS
jgi:hypothetical protein